jgi:hypothetical protein
MNTENLRSLGTLIIVVSVIMWLYSMWFAFVKDFNSETSWGDFGCRDIKTPYCDLRALNFSTGLAIWGVSFAVFLIGFSMRRVAIKRSLTSVL